MQAHQPCSLAQTDIAERAEQQDQEQTLHMLVCNTLLDDKLFKKDFPAKAALGAAGDAAQQQHALVCSCKRYAGVHPWQQLH